MNQTVIISSADDGHVKAVLVKLGEGYLPRESFMMACFGRVRVRVTFRKFKVNFHVLLLDRYLE